MAKGSYIGQVQIGDNTYPVGSILYGVCDTAAGTAAKVVSQASGKAYALVDATFNNDNLTAGVTIHIKFENSNTASNPTLKVGAADAKSIKQYGTTAAGTNEKTSWKAGAVVSFTYDGTNWVMNTGVDTDTIYIAADTAPNNIASTSVIGSSTNYARQDHTHGITLSSGDANGQVKIAGTNVNVTGLDTAAYAKVATTPISDGDTSGDLPTKAQVATYLENRTASLTGAMHFIGITSTVLTDGSTTATLVAESAGSLSKTTGFDPGDVVLYGGGEYVWSGSSWELLGDESSYALKSNIAQVIKTVTFTQNTLPTLTVTSTDIPNVTNAGTAAELTKTDVSIPNITDVGSAPTFTINNGTLTLAAGTVPQLGTAISATRIDSWTTNTPATLGTAISVGSASGWNAGSQASLTTTEENVVVPGPTA